MNQRAVPRCFIAGHRGLVGSALVRALDARGYPTPITRSRDELDLLDQRAVRDFFREERPDVVFFAAAIVGGILANNTERWSFIYENLVLATNVLGAALETDVDRLVFFGSSCIYPKLAPQPIKEEYLLTGLLEPTNEPYAIAKIAGLKLVEAANDRYGKTWVSIMPTNLYGPGDNFDLQTAHVLPALIRKFHEAKEARSRGVDAGVTLWGSGNVRREFMHVDDAAQASIRLMEQRETGVFNAGYGDDLSVRELAAIIARIVGYDGPVTWDSSKPDGTPRKLLDSSKIRATGWAPTISLEDGIRSVYEWFREASERNLARAAG
jgi:GDP-L-fucose synthase